MREVDHPRRKQRYIEHCANDIWAFVRERRSNLDSQAMTVAITEMLTKMCNGYDGIIKGLNDRITVLNKANDELRAKIKKLDSEPARLRKMISEITKPPKSEPKPVVEVPNG